MIADLPHCPLPGEIIEIAAPEMSFTDEALTFILEPFQPLREQLIAITGLGLEAELDSSDVSLRRVRTSGLQGQDLAVLAAGQPGGARTIFIHGSPGLGEEWMSFLGSVPDGRLYLAPDRPGFGDSGEEPVSELQQQADALVSLLGTAPQPPVILVGYSYGGPVALRLAADHPDRVKGLLLIGAAADPGLEEIHPLQEIAALPFFEMMLPTELANANAELIELRSGLEELAEELTDLHLPVTIVQGTADNLVPALNAAYLRTRLPDLPATIMVEDADHFLPWSHPALLTEALDCLADPAAPQPPEAAVPDR